MALIDARQSVFNCVGRDQHINFGSSTRQQTLERLHPVEMDASTRLECLPGTRVEMIKAIREWVADPSIDRNVFWLHGLAGSGKSTLMTTISHIFMELGQLGAFLFFDRDSSERNRPNVVIRTMAYQLALFDSRIGSKISEAIEGNPKIIYSSLRLQFLKLLVEPLCSPDILQSEGSVVLILDALDECGSPKDRKELLNLLGNESVRLPSALRFIFTSRQELDIQKAFEDKRHVLVRELDITSSDNDRDIISFFRHQLSVIRNYSDSLTLALDWPGHDMDHVLTRRAAGLFIWASTACAFIEDGHDPRKRLRLLVGADAASGAMSALDALYTTALQTAGKWDDPDFGVDFRAILGVILVARNPISHNTIDKLLCITDDRPSFLTISRLGCVLTQHPVVRILHPSFADFLSDRVRCGTDMWFIEPTAHNRNLAIRCLCLLQGILKRNICGLLLSREAVNASLEEHVAYACSFWVDHVCGVVDDILLIADHLDQFLFQHLLHWLEGMSILKKSRKAIGLLHRLLTWVEKYAPDRQLLGDLIRDGYRFAQAFAESIERHPLLIYMSALPFTPILTTLYKTFHNKNDCPWITGGYQNSWDPLLLVLSGDTRSIFCIAISPDGTRLASGSQDGTVLMWDTMTGSQVTDPLCGHKGIVQSIIFSPDGTRIASSSDDLPICVRDSASGDQLLVLTRRSCYIRSMMFFPDGMRILSRSKNNIINIWDLELRTVVVVPLPHKSTFSCVTFSPNGKYICSMGKANTGKANIIHVWEVESGAMACQPMKLWRVVKSLGFSSDGHRIVACCMGTITVWSTISGALTCKWPSRGCPLTATFSPDGTRIVSASQEGMIRLWDAASGGLLRIFRTHRSQIRNLIFTLDGTKVISATVDGIIQVWHTRLQSDAPTVGKTRGVSCLLFSQDGTRLASLSRHRALTVWDTNSCQPLFRSNPWGKHTASSLAFSPDGARVVCVFMSMRGRAFYIVVYDVGSGARLFIVQPPRRTRAPLCDYHSMAIFSNGSEIIIDFVPCSGAQITDLPNAQQSVSFSSDGSKVVFKSTVGVGCSWDASSGAVIPISPPRLPRRVEVVRTPSFVLGKDRWIEYDDTHVCRVVAKLPNLVTGHAKIQTATFKTSLVVTDEARERLVIMHFPANTLSNLKL